MTATGARTCVAMMTTVEGGLLRVLKVVFGPIGVLGVDSAPRPRSCEGLEGPGKQQKACLIRTGHFLGGVAEAQGWRGV